VWQCDLARHQHVVDHQQRALGDERLGQAQVVAVLAFGGIEEDQIEGAPERRDRVACIALDDLEALADPGAVEQLAGARDPRTLVLERHDAALGQLLGHVQRGIADRGADLEHARIGGAAQRGEQAAGLPGDDRDRVALRERLHLGHHAVALGAQ